MGGFFTSTLILLFAGGTAEASPVQQRLWEAARTGNAEAIRTAVAEGADVNAGAEYDVTALAFSARHGHLDAVRALIELGAEVDAYDDFYRRTPLFWAVYNDHVDVAILLIEAGASDLGDITRLSARKGKLELLGALIRSGRVEAEDLNAALDTARHAEQPAAVEQLLEAGAKDVGNQIPIDADALQRFVGRYELVPDTEIIIRREGAQLYAQITGQAEYKIYAKTPITFFYTIVRAKLEFVTDASGACNELVIHQRGHEVSARRITADAPPAPGKGALGPGALDAFVGDYEAETGHKFKVRLEDGKLAVGPPGRPPYALVHVQEDTFHIDRAPSVLLTFVRDGGQVVGYTVVPQGATLYRHRVGVKRGNISDTTSTGNWPSFRGPHASGIGDGLSAPTTWHAERDTGILWKTPIPGLGHASPIVWGDNVFITTAVSSAGESAFEADGGGDVESITEAVPQQWKVYCLDRATGEIRWERTSREGVPKLSRHPKSSQANCTPATDGEHVVVFFASEGLFCYDVEGTLLWSTDPGLLSAGWFYDEGVQWGFGSSPIIHDDLVITQCDRMRDSYIAAYDVNTGKPVWRTERDEIPSWATPTVYTGDGRTELLTQAPRAIRSYDPATGKELWRLTGNSEVTVATPVAGAGLFFFTANYPPIRPIYAVKPGAEGDISLADGETSNAYVAWSDLKGGTYLPTPLVYRDTLITLANNGVVSFYGARSGERLHRLRLGDGADSFTASPVAADGRAYFTAEDGDVYIVATTHVPTLVAVSPLNEVCLATPAITDGMLIFRTQGHVVAVGHGAGSHTRGAK